MFGMQRIGLLLVGLLALGGPRATAQQAAGTTLWRVAATTLATPAALAVGPAAALWNPAQTEDGARLQLGVEAIQTPSAVDATGVIATVRVPAGALGQVGVLFGRVGLSDISQTIDSPDPTGGVISVYTLTMDVGASRTFANDRLRVAAATHFFSSLESNDPSQDIYAGIEGRIWSGPLSGDRVVVRGRYGISFAHGFTADHQFGAGAEFSKTLALDLMLAREGGYGNRGVSWRPVAGVRIAIGKYRITLARDAGVNDLGSAYRVGVDARFR